jgi:hypothetical protein
VTTVVIAPGPASVGSPSGMMPMSSFPWSTTSTASCIVVFTPERRACSMSAPMPRKMIPPAMRKAGVVIPYSRMIQLPSAVNAISTRTAVITARRRVWLRRSAGRSEVIAR